MQETLISVSCVLLLHMLSFILLLIKKMSFILLLIKKC